MGVYIKGVSGLPSSCWQCIFVKQRGTSLRTFGDCPFLGTVIGPSRECITKRHDDCPLVELPSKHGRLIDARRFEDENNYFWNRDFVNPKYSETLADLVNEAPTVLEAEG